MLCLAYTNDVRRFVLIFAPVWGVIMLAQAVRSFLVTLTGQPDGESLIWRLVFLGIAAFYSLMAFACWRVFNFYLKKKDSARF